MKSPFEYTSPEAISANDIIDLFVPVFGEYLNIPNVGHTFVNGPRGSGKSMIFRYMSPDCQILVQAKKVKELDYFGIHIPIKEGQLDKTDLSLLNGKHGEYMLNEHFMVTNFSIKIFEKLSEIEFEETEENLKDLKEFFETTFKEYLSFSRWNKSYEVSKKKSCKEIFQFIKMIFSEINREFSYTFIPQLTDNEEMGSYNGPICLFNDFLLEILKSIKDLKIMPEGPIFLLIDDADNLNETQTKILNTWVSSRTSKYVSFKISTQLKYKTYKTINNSRIDTPHDYSEINISDIYTSKRGLYKDRVKQAVERRLKKFGFKEIDVNDFFPEDDKQETSIESLFEDYKQKYNYDYAYRYARPDFMKSLKGNLNTYSYAGFRSLVNISSGVMRHFIDFAHRMYTHQASKMDIDKVECIDPSIQDTEIKEYSSWFFDENFTKLRDDTDNTDDETSDFDKLRNLIEALGQTFHLILFSDAKERRVFSFALQDDPSQELRKILKLGVENGYFHKSLIGNKRGTGKSQLFILNRLLAPYFKLDPTSFAGYKFVTCDVLEKAMYKPNTIIGKIKINGVDSVMDSPQQTLFKDLYDE